MVDAMQKVQPKKANSAVHTISTAVMQTIQTRNSKQTFWPQGLSLWTLKFDSGSMGSRWMDCYYSNANKTQKYETFS